LLEQWQKMTNQTDKCGNGLFMAILHCVGRQLFIQCPATEVNENNADCPKLVAFANSCPAFPFPDRKPPQGPPPSGTTTNAPANGGNNPAANTQNSGNKGAKGGKDNKGAQGGKDNKGGAKPSAAPADKKQDSKGTKPTTPPKKQN
jgi:hypothetical protein